MKVITLFFVIALLFTTILAVKDQAKIQYSHQEILEHIVMVDIIDDNDDDEISFEEHQLFLQAFVKEQDISAFVKEKDKELQYIKDLYKGLDKNGDSVVMVEEYYNIFQQFDIRISQEEQQQQEEASKQEEEL